MKKAVDFVMKIIGLTGGIATGKSAVSTILSKKGYQVLDADAVVRQLQVAGSPLLNEMAKAFGTTILNEDGSLNRTKLGGMIFSDEKKRAMLDNLVHPAVRAEFERQIQLAKTDMLFLDVPLLFEAGFDDLADITLVVKASTKRQLERLMLRDGSSERDAQARIDSQMAMNEKVKLADFVIDNEGDLYELAENVERFCENIRGEK